VTLEDLGERALIERVRRRVAAAGGAPPVIGIGDDAALVAPVSPRGMLVTVDAALEGIHFRQDFSTPREVGWKAAAGALSDIAAMGGVARHLFLTLGAPPRTRVETIDALLDGLLDLAGRHGVSLAGGDTIASPERILLALTAVGEPAGERAITRAGARPGDALLVTGTLGASLAGLTLLREAPALAIPKFAAALARHRTPEPRLAEGALLATAFHPTAMIDVSDGLATDVGHLAAESAVGFRVDLASLPIDDGARAVAAALGRDPIEFALASGEEYELLFTAPRDEADAIREALARAACAPATIIGEATAERAVRARAPSGRERELHPTGFEHFRG
jgi:thiamine-monophosphate kinase